MPAVPPKPGAEKPAQTPSYRSVAQDPLREERDVGGQPDQQHHGEHAAAAQDRVDERVVAVLPRDWESWNNLGNSRLHAGDVNGAIEALRRAAHRIARLAANLRRFSRSALKWRRLHGLPIQLKST